MARQSNLAASLGGWSARHRISAIAGWLLLVVIAMLIGSAVGQVTMTQAEYGTGESGRAAQLLSDAGITEPAQELVLMHNATATAGPRFPGGCPRRRLRPAGHGRVQDTCSCRVEGPA